jgi:UDP-N-acetylglucosamine diphosphorylase/glucosamine-1-phosphate N-acetyltransferase
LAIVAAMRGVFDLRCGGRTLLERLRDDAGTRELVLVARPALGGLLRETHPEARLGTLPDLPGDAPIGFANGRLLALGNDLGRLLEGPPTGFALFDGEALVTARCGSSEAARLVAALAARLDGAAAGQSPRLPLADWIAQQLPQLQILRLDAASERRRDGSRLVAHVWDLVHHNGPAIIDDFRKGPGAGVDAGALLYPGVHLLQDGAIRIGAGCRLKPGVVLDAEDGPITLEPDTELQPHVVVRGPAHIGRRCLLKAGAKVHEGTSLGPVCKIGGEVEECVVQGFSNKQHEGFLGHAYLGEWVNLGADTNNSDLKNNYSTVRVWESGRGVDSGLLFVGLLAGDHVKSAINVQFNTGTVVGLSSQIFGAGFPPKFIAPFSWGGAERLDLYDFDRALATARVVMQRRQVTLSEAYAGAFRAVFDTWRDGPRSQSVG